MRSENEVTLGQRIQALKAYAQTLYMDKQAGVELHDSTLRRLLQHIHEVQLASEALADDVNKLEAELQQIAEDLPSVLGR